MKRLFLFIAIIIIGVTGLFLFLVYYFGNGTLVVTSSLESCQFMFDRKLYVNTPQTIKNIKPGTYTIIAHKPGYKDQEYVVIIERLKTTKIELLLIETVINEAEKKMSTYESDIIKKNQEIVAKRIIDHPLTNFLPYFSDPIIFDYIVNRDNSISYIVRALPNKNYIKEDYVELISSFIKSKGVDPLTVVITWK